MSLRDWWRGYNAADILTLREALGRLGPEIYDSVWLTPAETLALGEGHGGRPVAVRTVQGGRALVSVARRRCPHCGQPI